MVTHRAKIALAVTAMMAFATAVFAQGQLAPAPINQPWYMVSRLSSAISVTTSSGATALPTTGVTAWLANTGSNDAYYSLGSANTVTTSTTTGDYLKAGTCAIVNLFPIGQASPFTYVALIGSGGSTTVTVETGIGQPPCQPASGGSTVTANQGTPGSSPWPVNGNQSNASSGVGTNPSNVPAIAYLYGFNGTTWDQLQVDGSKNLKVVDTPASGANFNTTTYAPSTLPSSSITRPASTTTYTANTGWNNGTPTYFSFSNACRVNGGVSTIGSVDIYSSANPTTKLAGTLYLFNAVPGTLISDNETFTVASSDWSSLAATLNGIPFTLANPTGNSGNTNSGTTLATNLPVYCASGSTTLYGVVEVTNAYVASESVASATVNAGGSGYGTSLSGTMMWSGSGCELNPILNVTTNSSGVINAVSSVATAGNCTTFPSSTATTWTAGGGLSAGSSAEFALTGAGEVLTVRLRPIGIN